jgi:hypothetical protein
MLSGVIRHAIEVPVHYRQFYVWDGGVAPSAPEDYTDEDVRRMVIVAPNVIVVQPVRNATVPMELEVHGSDPGFDAAEWDHVVECSVDVPTGNLHVESCMHGTELELKIARGSYAARVLFAGLDTISDDGDCGSDRYRVVLWPAKARPLRVVKRWPNARPG